MFVTRPEDACLSLQSGLRSVRGNLANRVALDEGWVPELKLMKAKKVGQI
jgi:hypothetical protein